MTKQIFYLTGTFRCGTTLLRSIINQNPEFYTTPNSIIPGIVWLLDRFKQHPEYKNWKCVDVDKQYTNNEKHYDEVIKNTFKNYFSKHKQKYILEQGRWGTLENFNLLKHYGFLPAKFVILVRPLKEILESWNRVDKIPNALISRHCDTLMEPGGRVGQAAAALDFLTKHYRENLLIIKYKNLCKKPEKTIKNLYKFLEIPFYNKHKFNNLNQVDSGESDHTKIRTGEVTEKIHVDKIKIPDTVLKKYKKENNLFKQHG